MPTSTLIRRFWYIVGTCLIQFHKQSHADATNTVRNLQKLSNDPDSNVGQMVYHNDPWNVACNIARKDLPVHEHIETYNKILEKAKTIS